ncbi:HNH endonuclease signature motif containing protein [Arthrobacter sp. 135MFCol5.1]|uniref:HNH endonuclease signature motif containing protein n=1 Tax=Arthrobacter sp. 135MFCol5.1 TaxID=1158050 RepID=UPI00039D0A80|nr:HNH endonuclease signature motif containing protein [Arthrobacter sp. 135MFCol5.1]
MEAGVVAGAGGRAAIASAVASVAGLVHELERVVAGGSPAGAGPDPLRELSEASLEGLEVLARIEAATAAAKVRMIALHAEAATLLEAPPAGAYRESAQEMTMVAEIACVLTIGERAASALLGQAHALTTTLPAALDALQAGTISWQHARAVVDETTGLDPARAAALVAHFFDPEDPNPARGAAPGDLVPSRFRRKVRAWRERTFPESLEERHAIGVADRRMEYRPDVDGMAWLSLYLPGDTACAVWNKASAVARGLQGPGEGRTLTQLRADVAAALLMGARAGGAAVAGSNPAAGSNPGAAGDASNRDASNPGAAGDVGHDAGRSFDAGNGPHTEDGNPYAVDLSRIPTPRADVLVTVPVFSLLGLTDEPADLDGFGPIPASMARRLVADGAGSFYRVLVDPRDGAPLEIGRTSYRLPESMKRWIRMRDGRCTFPGCSNHTQDNETDHLTAWQHGGTTGISNLGQLCPKHHRLKHSSTWTPTPATMNEPPGWTSPAGRHYPAEQPDWQKPQWPPGFPAAEWIVPPGCPPGGASPFEEIIVAYLAS